MTIPSNSPSPRLHMPTPLPPVKSLDLNSKISGIEIKLNTDDSDDERQLNSPLSNSPKLSPLEVVTPHPKELELPNRVILNEDGNIDHLANRHEVIQEIRDRENARCFPSDISNLNITYESVERNGQSVLVRNYTYRLESSFNEMWCKVACCSISFSIVIGGICTALLHAFGSKTNLERDFGN